MPSFLVPAPYNKGKGGSAEPLAISKTDVPMNMKFCMLLETSLNTLEMSKFLIQWLTGCYSNYSSTMCSRYQPKIANIQMATKSTVLKITIWNFSRYIVCTVYLEFRWDLLWNFSIMILIALTWARIPTLYNVCSVHRGISWVHRGGNHEYIRGCSVHRGNVMMNVGDTRSTLGNVQYIRGIPWVHRGDTMSTSGDVQ